MVVELSDPQTVYVRLEKAVKATEQLVDTLDSLLKVATNGTLQNLAAKALHIEDELRFYLDEVGKELF